MNIDVYHSALAFCIMQLYLTKSVRDKGSHIKYDQVEEDHQGMYDEANDVLQLAHYSLSVLQGEG